MPRKKIGKSTAASNGEPNHRTKMSKVERDMNTALSLMESHREQDGIKAETLSSQRLSEFERGKRKETGLAEYKKLSTEKHTDNMRHKIAYVADQLIEEMAHEVSKKTKKDKEYLKGLTWSFGVLHDKLTAVNTEATLVSLPTKLLDAVKGVIQQQVELAKQNAVVSTELRSIQQGAVPTKEPIDVTPVVQDTTENYVREVDRRSRTEGYVVHTSENKDPNEDYVSTSPERSTTSEKLPT